MRDYSKMPKVGRRKRLLNKTRMGGAGSIMSGVVDSTPSAESVIISYDEGAKKKLAILKTYNSFLSVGSAPPVPITGENVFKVSAGCRVKFRKDKDGILTGTVFAKPGFMSKLKDLFSA